MGGISRERQMRFSAIAATIAEVTLVLSRRSSASLGGKHQPNGTDGNDALRTTIARDCRFSQGTATHRTEPT
jgi:hypothetical protein